MERHDTPLTRREKLLFAVIGILFAAGFTIVEILDHAVGYL